MIFDTWAGIGRVLLVGTFAYVALVLVLRISGKRTLTKLNAFDLVVTVSLGSTLATVLLSRTVPLAEGITALVLLVGLQFLITWLSVRWPSFERLVKSEPTLLMLRGSPLDAALRTQRVTLDEVVAAVRSQGIVDMAEVGAVVLETNGTISVLRRVPDPLPERSTLDPTARL